MLIIQGPIIMIWIQMNIYYYGIYRMIYIIKTSIFASKKYWKN